MLQIGGIRSIQKPDSEARGGWDECLVWMAATLNDSGSGALGFGRFEEGENVC
jgi:hypothetical protein